LSRKRKWTWMDLARSIHRIVEISWIPTCFLLVNSPAAVLTAIFILK
jgi:hypothetical protein